MDWTDHDSRLIQCAMMMMMMMMMIIIIIIIISVLCEKKVNC